MEACIFDSHSHYDDAAFEEDRSAVLESLPQNGISRILTLGTDVESSKTSIALAEAYSYIYAAAGIHPECAGDVPENYMEQLEPLLAHPKVKAVGEIGLDYHFADNAPREVQRTIFARQLELANAHTLPVSVHDRDAHGDTMELLHKYRPAGVVHCFSGSVEMAKEVLRLGMYIGLGGAVTFKNARVPVEVAAAIPLDRLLLETDCPYMAPVPFRGKRCDSTMILYTAARIAEIRGISSQEVLKAAQENAARLFDVPLDEYAHND